MSTSPYRNPAHLLGLGYDGRWVRFLRAAGADEASLSGRASDHELFGSLAAAMPLYRGHPVAQEIHACLCAETGLSTPLCPHTARAHWEAWVARHWYETESDPADPTAPFDPPASFDPPAPCPLCPPAEPCVILPRAVTVFPTPSELAEAGTDLDCWTQAVCAALQRDGRQGRAVLITLPPDYRFVRPDPYHAAAALRSAAGMTDTPLTSDERSCLYSQMMRVLWGDIRAVGGRILLAGGRAEEVAALMDYLHSVKYGDGAYANGRTKSRAQTAVPGVAAPGAADAVWLAPTPAEAGVLSGAYADVKTGLLLPRGTSLAAAAQMLVDYAAVAPIGCAFLYTEPSAPNAE